MKILQQSLQSQNHDTAYYTKRSVLDMFVDSGKRLNAIENQLTSMTQTFRHNIDIENHFNHQLYETERQLIDKDNENDKEIYNIKFGLLYLSFQHHYNIHDSITFSRVTDNLDTLQNLLQFYINIIMTHDKDEYYCNTEPLQTNEPTCI